MLRQVIRGGTLATGLMEFVVEGVNAQQTPARPFDFTLDRSCAVRCPTSSLLSRLHTNRRAHSPALLVSHTS